MPADDSYVLLDDALIRLRRLWSGTVPRPSAMADRVPPVEMSTVLVVTAIDRLQAARPDCQVTVADVAGHLDVAGSTASRLVDRAVTATMVIRRASATDTRRLALSLTAGGQSLLEAAGEFRLSYLEQVLDGWAAAEVDTFAMLLDRFAAAVHHRPPTTAGGASG
jgi:DNA-binding MarR family transcriptional regulator